MPFRQRATSQANFNVPNVPPTSSPDASRRAFERTTSVAAENRSRRSALRRVTRPCVYIPNCTESNIQIYIHKNANSCVLEEPVHDDDEEERKVERKLNSTRPGCGFRANAQMVNVRACPGSLSISLQ